MAGCVPCFVIPLLLFIFHRYIQPILLRFWNPWANKTVQDGKNEDTAKEECKFSCECAWSKKKTSGVETDPLEENKSDRESDFDEVEEDPLEDTDADYLRGHGIEEKVKSV